jgi:hypothetical protein
MLRAGGLWWTGASELVWCAMNARGGRASPCMPHIGFDLRLEKKWGFRHSGIQNRGIEGIPIPGLGFLFPNQKGDASWGPFQVLIATPIVPRERKVADLSIGLIIETSCLPDLSKKKRRQAFLGKRFLVVIALFPLLLLSSSDKIIPSNQLTLYRIRQKRPSFPNFTPMRRGVRGERSCW